VRYQIFYITLHRGRSAQGTLRFTFFVAFQQILLPSSPFVCDAVHCDKTIHPIAKVPEQVNRKCPLGTRFYNFEFQPPTGRPNLLKLSPLDQNFEIILIYFGPVFWPTLYISLS